MLFSKSCVFAESWMTVYSYRSGDRGKGLCVCMKVIDLLFVIMFAGQCIRERVAETPGGTLHVFSTKETRLWRW